MKIVWFLIMMITVSGFAQDTIVQIDTANKIHVLNPLPVELYNEVRTNGTGLEVTMYESGTTFSLPNLSGSNYFLSFLQGQAPSSFNSSNSGYIMILVKNDFFMDAEVSFSPSNSYVIFKYNGLKYYNLLNETGVSFFKKFFLGQ
ncbi:MAG: hypothetical protein ABF264_05855 [Flavobacteriales bacterium]